MLDDVIENHFLQLSFRCRYKELALGKLRFLFSELLTQKLNLCWKGASMSLILNTERLFPCGESFSPLEFVKIICQVPQFYSRLKCLLRSVPDELSAEQALKGLYSPRHPPQFSLQQQAAIFIANFLTKSLKNSVLHMPQFNLVSYFYTNCDT
jgi:hypothetical protein